MKVENLRQTYTNIKKQRILYDFIFDIDSNQDPKVYKHGELKKSDPKNTYHEITAFGSSEHTCML